MVTSIEDRVIDFFHTLFGEIFSKPFRLKVTHRLKLNAVIRQVEESADAASQSLTRFFLNQRLNHQQVSRLLQGLSNLGGRLALEGIANPNLTPESIVKDLLDETPCPDEVREEGQEAVYGVTLHSIVQVLMLVGPVMSQWQKLNFSSTFELPGRINNRLNQISKQMDAMGQAGLEAADEDYELIYRDHLLQRFYRVEAGTVRMTTNMAVDLRELFVMPRLLARQTPKEKKKEESKDQAHFMDLSTAREFFGASGVHRQGIEPEEKKVQGESALKRVKRYPLNVVVGEPGGGKSTLLEWLQLRLAGAEEVLVTGGQQAIPLLLRVRQLNPKKLPVGARLVQKATASKDLTDLMPPGWLDRQMKAGRVLFMLDGLDETDPGLRDKYVLPWLVELCKTYPDCRYLVSSRPVGYPPGALGGLRFKECDLLDFEEKDIAEYAQHWCTAVRLARNEPEKEARREGKEEGKQIVDGFKNHPYIPHLARNPLMLSAICLVNYFEGGHLPEDRALLYKLCVEGLLHHWDQRRGIHSEYSLEEKLRVCREVALAMQADDRAEYEDKKIQKIFAAVLGDGKRAKNLLEHIRYRTGLLIERRPGVFAFAHLTFQEYLAALAVHEGNRIGIEADRLGHEHSDPRWQEVIPLYCGLAPTRAVKETIEKLIAEQDTAGLSSVLAEAYFSSGAEISQDAILRKKVINRIARAPRSLYRRGQHPFTLARFASEEVAPVANAAVGTSLFEGALSESYTWLGFKPRHMDFRLLTAKIRSWRSLNSFQRSELIYLLLRYGPDKVLADIASESDIYLCKGPRFSRDRRYHSQAEIALIGITQNLSESIRSSTRSLSRQGFATLLMILDSLAGAAKISPNVWRFVFSDRERPNLFSTLPPDSSTWQEFASVARKLAHRLEKGQQSKSSAKFAIKSLSSWAGMLEKAIAEEERRVKAKAKKTKKPLSKKSPKKSTRKAKVKGAKRVTKKQAKKRR